MRRCSKPHRACSGPRQPIGKILSRPSAGRAITCTPTSSPTRRAAAAPASVAAFTEATSPRTIAGTRPASTFCHPTKTTFAALTMASAASIMPTRPRVSTRPSASPGRSCATAAILLRDAAACRDAQPVHGLVLVDDPGLVYEIRHRAGVIWNDPDEIARGEPAAVADDSHRRVFLREPLDDEGRVGRRRLEALLDHAVSHGAARG